MSKEIKSQIYYLVRRGWHGQLVQCCEAAMARKGKEPVTLFWHAFGLGMSGNINEALRELESFQARRDLQYAVNIALMYFHKKAAQVDKEAIAALKSELSVAEDVTKEAGLVLAARFLLFTGNHNEARRIAKRFAGQGTGGTGMSVFELEAYMIEQWSIVEEISQTWADSSDQRRSLAAIDSTFKNNRGGDLQDADALMLWAKSRHLLGLTNDVLNILNQAISIYPTFAPALADKALLLASSNDWDQALDSAQRVLDIDPEYLDALQIIAVHGFTQESQPHDAIQKLEDVDKALKSRESAAVDYTIELAVLFSKICSRQPRALQICARMLERSLKFTTNNESEAKVLSELGHIYIMQGAGLYEKAMKSFKEATKKDPNNVRVLMGLILCQICEGSVDDAESQIELLGLMHNLDDLGFELLYLQSLILKFKKTAKKEHLEALHKCKAVFQRAKEEVFSPTQLMLGIGRHTYLNAFQSLSSGDPEFSMSLALDFFQHIEFAGTTSLVPSTNSLLNGGSNDENGNPNSAVFASSSSNKFGQQSMMDEPSSSSSESAEDVSFPMQCGLELIQNVLNLCPGMVAAYLERARSYCAIGRYEEAARTLQQCLSLQPQSASILIAMAHVEVGRFKTSVADRLLEQALASDFSIRSVPKFRLIKSIIRAQQGKFSESISEMEQIMSLPEFGFNPSGESDASLISMLKSGTIMVNSSYSDTLRLIDDDRVSAFVCYASMLSKERRMKEANKVLSHAKVIFAGTSQEVQVLVAASQLYVEKGDFDAAIRMLDKISPDSASYKRAQMVKADIILNHNHDREGFTKCFESLVDKDHSSHSLILLGDAYLRILNPEAAIDALEKAYKLDPSNGRLRSKIGRALIATHEYHRAVEFYEGALREASRSPKLTDAALLDNLNLSHDLAKLYLKLGRYESAARVLNDTLQDNRADTMTMKHDVRTLVLLSKVQNVYAPHELIDTLQRAYKTQKDVLAKLRTSGAVGAMSEAIEEEKFMLSSLCEKLGSTYLRDENQADAEHFLQEAVQHNPQNTVAMLSLARVYFSKGDFEQCQNQCNKVITGSPDDRDAAILLSDVLLQNDEPEKAVVPLANFMKLRPNDYVGLEKTISLLRRAGKLQDAQGFLTAAEKSDRRCVSHAGFHYCQGLYARFTNDIGKAISEFNLARKDDIWGANALTHMIELYLNPDQDGIWEERESGPVDDATRANIAAAEVLLKELRPIAKDELRVRVLESYCAMATRNKVSVDRAMQSFVEMLDNDQDYLPAVLGMATGFMIEKNQHKARNLLKRVGKMEMNKHDGEDFEKANLLLAKFYIDKAKNDLAQEMCKKTLVQNKSCSQAWEILGLIFEKEGNYEMASDAYQKAWVLEFEASAPVGFKLAFSYLKCKKFIEAIDVCEAVLRQYPDYPRISEEILSKALQSIRTASIVN